jgi:hypothetical protein
MHGKGRRPRLRRRQRGILLIGLVHLGGSAIRNRSPLHIAACGVPPRKIDQKSTDDAGLKMLPGTSIVTV